MLSADLAGASSTPTIPIPGKAAFGLLSGKGSGVETQGRRASWELCRGTALRPVRPSVWPRLLVSSDPYHLPLIRVVDLNCGDVQVQLSWVQSIQRRQADVGCRAGVSSCRRSVISNTAGRVFERDYTALHTTPGQDHHDVFGRSCIHCRCSESADEIKA